MSLSTGTTKRVVVGATLLAAAALLWWVAGTGTPAISEQISAQVSEQNDPLHCDNVLARTPLAGPQPGTAPQRGPHPTDAAQGSGMVWVPSGRLDFGDTVYPEEGPVRAVDVAGFWMDRTEVTNAQFAAFVSATGYRTTAERAVDPRLHPGLPAEMQQPGAVVFINPADLPRGGDLRQWWQYVPGAYWRQPQGPGSSIAGREAFPVVAVTLEDAQAYARWAGRALPTEIEWEWAAQSSQESAATATPTPKPTATATTTATKGKTVQPTQANTWQGLFPLNNARQDGFAGVAPVGCFAPNALGLFDMIGNVWELTADPYTESHSESHDGRHNLPPDQPPVVQRLPAPGTRQVIKGGSYLCAPNYCMRYRAGSRQPQEADLATSHVGFRTVLRKIP